MTTVLVIDDQITAREITTDILTAVGFKVVTAASGQAGIHIARTQRPDLILCDIAMPQMTGYEVLQAIRQYPATAMTPFIFLSAQTEKVHQRKGMELGADDYLTKPFTPSELIQALKARLEKQTALQTFSQQALDTLRHSLSATLPHELRTPLHGITGFAQLLKMSAIAQDPAEVAEIADCILTSAARLEQLIDKFLLYGRLNSLVSSPQVPKMLQVQPCAVSQLVALPAQQQAEKADRLADLELILPDIDELVCSQFSLSKITEELTENAFKFSAVGDRVEIHCQSEPNWLILTVTNQGRGMTATQIAEISAYHQFDRAHYEQQGLGLGLAIAQRLAELQGGSLTITSTPESDISVRVKLPILSAAIAEAETPSEA
ncbi:MAG: hybrid sensor histidine kinase/response regulator [Almyronema sp.]